jgi:hypothetical protein
VIRGDATEFLYDRKKQPYPKLGPFEAALLKQLESDITRPLRQQRTAMVLFATLKGDRLLFLVK